MTSIKVPKSRMTPTSRNARTKPQPTTKAKSAQILLLNLIHRWMAIKTGMINLWKNVKKAWSWSLTRTYAKSTYIDKNPGLAEDKPFNTEY